MGGIFGVASKTSCTMDLFFGIDYHSHLGTRPYTAKTASSAPSTTSKTHPSGPNLTTIWMSWRELWALAVSQTWIPSPC